VLHQKYERVGGHRLSGDDHIPLILAVRVIDKHNRLARAERRYYLVKWV
jgi:hypothetical protein